MKLCPQCDFIYEDDQSLCDMDGAELVYEATLRALTKNATPEPARLIVPLSNLPKVKTLTAPPKVFAASRSPRLRIAAGVVLAAAVFGAYYASPRLFSTRAETPANKLENQNPRLGTDDPQAGREGASQDNNSSSSPASDQSPSDLKSPSSASTSPASTSSLNIEEDQAATTTASTDRARNGSDNRLTIPRVPQLSSYPRVPPLRRLPVAKAESKKPGSASADAKPSTSQAQVVQAPVVVQKPAPSQTQAVASQKPVSPNDKPASTNEKKPSRFGSFLKKTGRLLTKPFKDKP